jgi:hypothetical protein
MYKNISEEKYNEVWNRLVKKFNITDEDVQLWVEIETKNREMN